MSKTVKFGNAKLIPVKIDGCVIVPYWGIDSSIQVICTKDDPGAVHVLFKTTGGCHAILRGVYDQEVARNIPKPGKPQTRAFYLNIGYDNRIVYFGNYNIADDKVEDDVSKPHMIDDILLLTSDFDNVPTYHDSEGFVRLKKLYPYRVATDDGSYEKYGPDIYVYCYGVSKNNEKVINLVNAIVTFSDRANVSYNGASYRDVYGYTSVDTPMFRILSSQDAIRTIGDAAEEIGMVDTIVDLIISRIVSELVLVEDDKKNEANRLARGSKRRTRFRDLPYKQNDMRNLMSFVH